MSSFEYNQAPLRVVFGSGTLAKVPAELHRLKVSKPLILCTPEQTFQAEKIEEVVKSGEGITPAGVFPKATMHTPGHITDEALEFLKSSGADSLVSIGGGSTTGLGKALAVRTGLPHLSVPTTYAGSEMTPILGETVGGEKRTRSDPKILPTAVIYDVDLTMTLPSGLSATSGVNAIAHSVEGLYAQNGNPIMSLMALEGIRSLAASLPTVVATPSDVHTRSQALYGAWLCGAVLGNVGMALHHKLCHTLGGSFNLPHAETHTIVLPHALAYNAPAIPEVMHKLADALPGSDGDAIHGLNILLTKLKVKRGLKEFGMKEEDVDKAAEIATRNPYWNPRDIEKDKIREVIRRCWAGEEARADL
ncbi:maleylacetate reductase [Dacryopinax primogenitus]|uniref:Maleylacetate reductase n=1 Tax=Dacryopinax primogenitus (strain DJM 731) TaxID=1858805 RepID=M5G9W2_DACPD|nr:maleylacetate reductase [Dacryopinax primogenitus]EJU05100.1 maleylacetate reductase [Dacryopinax primogenitus]